MVKPTNIFNLHNFHVLDVKLELIRALYPILSLLYMEIAWICTAAKYKFCKNLWNSTRLQVFHYYSFDILHTHLIANFNDFSCLQSLNFYSSLATCYKQYGIVTIASLYTVQYKILAGANCGRLGQSTQPLSTNSFYPSWFTNVLW